jgi:tetratricopeptide (TPR) repeat protein
MIDAIICMDGGLVFGFQENRWIDFVYYNPHKVRAPFMFMANSTYRKDKEWDFFDGIKYTKKYLLQFHGLAHGNFSSLANLNRLYLLFYLYNNKNNEAISQREYRERSGKIVRPPKNVTEIYSDRVIAGYNTVCRYTLNFFATYLKSSDEGALFIDNSPLQKNIPRKVVTGEISEGLPIPPTEREFYEIIHRQGVPFAVTLFHAYRDRDPQLLIFSEESMNQLGYTYLQTQFLDDAIELFTLNVISYPQSWNVYDSLAEAYAQKGDIQSAITNYKKSLDINPKNDNAKRMLQQLR